MFLAKAHYREGAGFSNVEYGLMAEMLGKSRLASEVCLYILACSVIRAMANVVLDDIGDQQCCSGYRQHGGDCQVRQ
jgi:hypothetical protein